MTLLSRLLAMVTGSRADRRGSSRHAVSTAPPAQPAIAGSGHGPVFKKIAQFPGETEAMYRWRCRQIMWKQGLIQSQPPPTPHEAGILDNQHHFTACVEHIKQLKREGRFSEAIDLSWRCVRAMEAEAEWGDGRPRYAPGWYWNLAIMYQKAGDPVGEVAVIERAIEKFKREGYRDGRYEDRLVKARSRLARHDAEKESKGRRPKATD